MTNEMPTPEVLVLRKVGHLYALNSLQKHLVHVYEAFSEKMVSITTFGTEIKNELINACAELKPEIVSLVDSFAPPDHVVNSILGYADGNIYGHLYEALSATESNPLWMKDEDGVKMMKRDENDVHKHVLLSKL